VDLFAVAQKEHVYIYDSKGVEVHYLEKLWATRILDFLPYHYLLVAASDTRLRYLDTSTGQLLFTHRFNGSACTTMKQNPYNAVICVGHGNGTVAMFTPNSHKPVASVITHKGPLTALDVNVDGKYMVTAGQDGHFRVWDIRKFKQIQEYWTIRPASCVDISQRGLVATGQGSRVEVWKDLFLENQSTPYLTQYYDNLRDLQFCPYEDFLGVGHSDGYASMVVPGSGEPNFDTFEENPFQTTRQKDEHTVATLLDKMPADMIALNPDFINTLLPTTNRGKEYKKKRQEEDNLAQVLTPQQVQILDYGKRVVKNQHTAALEKIMKEE